MAIQETWKTAVIQTLNAVSALRSIVGSRIYPAYLADIRDPKFPCLNFASEGGSRRVSYLTYANMSVRFWIWSDKNFQQAHSILNLILSTLNNQIVTSEEANFSFYQMTEPVELRNDNLRGVTCAFLVRKI